MAPLAVHVVTGFLGAGKTTLINALLREPALAASAVLVNEYGAVGVDQALLVRQGADVVLLKGGCVCCAVRDGLAATLLDLAARRDSGELPPFERVLIETTGLADPFPIVALLAADAELAARYRLAQVLTVVDAVRGEALWAERREAAAQLAAADAVWISKAAQAPADAHEPLRAAVQALNPGAVVLAGDEPGALARLVETVAGSGGRAPAWAAAPPSRAAGAVHGWTCACCRPLALAGTPAAAHGVQAVVIERDRPFAWDVLGAWLESLLQAGGDGLLRLKGIVWIVGESAPSPWVLQGVQTRLDAPQPWPAATADDMRRHASRIVLIGTALDALAAQDALDAIEAAAQRADDAAAGASVAQPRLRPRAR